ncbi:flagellar filament capping protein FliD [Clostridium paridis]|uniref:Flagellar hook-associated protein 2 n=1 Tax=Clostridium paridis TaxID=2803863 RepID=A0A937K5S8_9CLOT|nr:flagellar filament capping protein FliD [Clostridium paridis]MBL4932908.1 flagellar filament capping protein FliD [Clostridium paridis]
MSSVSSSTSTQNMSGNRVTGLSGMDVESMVKAAMLGQQNKINKAMQQKQLVQFQQEAYRDVIKDLRDFYSKYTDITKTDTSLLLSKNYQTSVFNSPSPAVSAVGLSGAQVGTYKVQVNKLATPAQVEYSDFSGLLNKSNDIYIDGKKVTVDLTGITSATDSATINTIVTKFNDAITNAGVSAKMSRSDLSGKYILQTTGTGSNQTIGMAPIQTTVALGNLAGKILTFNIDGYGYDVDLSAYTNLPTDNDTILAAIRNGTSGKLGYTSDGTNVTFTTTSLGSSSSFGIVNKTTGTNIVPLINGSNQALNSRGTDSEVQVSDTYGNNNITKTFQGNDFVIDNVKFTISDVTPSPVVISGKTDVEDLKKRIVNFVNDYNNLLDKITTKLQEKKNPDYPPLTDDQKSSMTQDQINQWEAKTKEGLLRNDNYLSSIVSQLRSAFNTPVTGSNMKYYDMGIDFTNDYTKPGQLVIDEDKLTTALQNDPDKVYKLFTSAANPLDTKEKQFNDSGIVQRFKTILNDNVINSGSQLLKKVGFEGTLTFYNNDMKKTIDDQTKSILDMQEKFTDQQNRLYQRYAALETAMNNYNSQATYLSSAFGGGQ